MRHGTVALGLWLAMVFSGCVGCALLRESRVATTPRPPTTTRYNFPDTLPDESEVCVPARATGYPTYACVPLGELRHTLRTLRRASLEAR